MRELISQFHFLRPWWWLALLPLMLIFFLYRQQHRSSDAWQEVCDAHLLPQLLLNQTKQQARYWLWLLLGMWLIAVFALAGPTWRYRVQPTYQKQISRMVLLDLSPASLSTDLPPSRLLRARYKLLDILNNIKEGDVGLIAYAGEPYSVSPLTGDAKTIAAMINQLSPSIMPVAGNDLSKALSLAMKMLQQAGQTSGQIIVISSGNIDNDAAKTAAKLADAGYAVSVLGVGTNKRAPLASANGQFVHDENGNILFSQFDSNGLAAVAKAGHGIYQPFTSDDQDILRLLGQVDSNRVDKTKQSSVIKQWQDEGNWFVLLLLPLVLLAFRRAFIKRLT